MLVVCDDPVYRRMHTASLRTCGSHHWDIRESASVTEALASCDRSLPDCIVLRQRLPDGTGLGLITTLQRRFGKHAFASVLLTQAGDEDASVQAFRRAVSDCVYEPSLDAIGSLAARVRVAIRRSRLEAELVAGRENLAYRSHLFAMAVHDLRAPLMVVQGGLEELASHAEHSEEVRHMLALIQRSADRLVALTEELADLVAVDQGALRLRRTSTNLTAVVQQVVDELAHSADAAQRDIHLRCEGDAEAEVDPERISRVLTNLISNALRHAQHDVDVTVRGNGDHVEIAVQDDGAGVDPDVLPSLFERFVRGKNVRGAGLGLGLAIVRELVRAHGGNVHVLRRGDRERGACFVVDLPRRSEQLER